MIQIQTDLHGRFLVEFIAPGMRWPSHRFRVKSLVEVNVLLGHFWGKTHNLKKCAACKKLIRDQQKQEQKA